MSLSPEVNSHTNRPTGPIATEVIAVAAMSVISDFRSAPSWSRLTASSHMSELPLSEAQMASSPASPCRWPEPSAFAVPFGSPSASFNAAIDRPTFPK